MMTSRLAATRRAAAVMALAAAWSCTDVSDIDLVRVPDGGLVEGLAVLDLNGDGAYDSGDLRLADTKVILGSPGSQDTLLLDTTDANGLFFWLNVPLGTYRLDLDPAILGDSLTPAAGTGNVVVEFGDTTRRDVVVAYPTLTLAEVLQEAVAGRKIMTHGIALNNRQSNGDGVVHFQEGAAYLRATGVLPSVVGPGDSVRLLGRTAMDTGRPTLDQVTVAILRQSAVFLTPPLLTLAAAGTAGGGPYDAALIRIGVAEIRDTATVGTQTRFWAYLGTDSLELVLRDYLQIAPNPAIRPDTVVRVLRATGLLVPADASGTRWQLFPRGPADLVTENKSADVGVTVSFDTIAASVGDTVEVRVTARNGPAPQATHVATNVTVTSRVPAAFTFLSSTVTRGTYDQASGTWTVGDLTPGLPADTLRILVEVVAPGLVADTARFTGLVRELEFNASNNAASAILLIS